jgi:hypothetical protein
MKRPAGLRTREATLALILRAAESCAAAAQPECKCYCHGSMHGQPHSSEWVEKISAAIYEQQFRFIKPEYRHFYEEQAE